jgi:hypothetical protein
LVLMSLRPLFLHLRTPNRKIPREEVITPIIAGF